MLAGGMVDEVVDIGSMWGDTLRKVTNTGHSLGASKSPNLAETGSVR